MRYPFSQSSVSMVYVPGNADDVECAWEKALNSRRPVELGIKERFSSNFDKHDLSFWVIMGRHCRACLSFFKIYRLKFSQGTWSIFAH